MKNVWTKIGVIALIIGLIVDFFEFDAIFGVQSIFFSLYTFIVGILWFKISVWIFLLSFGALLIVKKYYFTLQ